MGGYLKQQVADALWELSEKYDVGVFNDRRDAVMAAKEPGVYLLIFVE